MRHPVSLFGAGATEPANDPEAGATRSDTRLKIASIDIGSNSIHTIVAAVCPGGGFEVVDREKDVVKLGRHAFQRRRLTEEAFHAGLLSLKRCRRMIERHGVQEVVAAATSAVREASNGARFLSEVEARTGIRPRMITGEEEAILIHRAVRHTIDLRRRRALIIDIGGGSVEVIVGDADGLRFGRSLPLGVLRLADRLHAVGPLSKDKKRQLTQIIQERAGEALSLARNIGFECVIGTSGTILNLGQVLHFRRERRGWVSPNGQRFTLLEVGALAELLRHMDPQGRLRVPGIDEHRAETIHVGALLVTELLRLSGCDTLSLCDASIREGLVLERLEALGQGASPDVDTRAASVVQLAARFHQDDTHSRHIRFLAGQLFEQLAPELRLGLGTAELLAHAALLHDIGRTVGFERHEHHGCYLVEHGGLRGFNPEEIDFIALAVRYHRKSSPKSRDAAYAALAPAWRRALRAAAGILRVAEGLDRGHAQLVRAVRCELDDQEARVIVAADGDASWEIAAAQRKSRLLGRVLRRSVVVRGEKVLA